MPKNVRISFPVDDKLYARIERIPWGVRAEVLRKLITRVMDSADEAGNLVYGAVIGGEFEIKYKTKKSRKGT